MFGRYSSRERIKLALNHVEPDHIPIHDTVWEATVERWRKEGLPDDVSPSDYFGYEMVRFCPDLSPQFTEQTLEENEEYIVEKNRFGEIVKNHKSRSTTPQVIKSPVKNKNDWERIKERLVPDESRKVSPTIVSKSTLLVDMNRAVQNFKEEQHKGKFILYSAGMGYDILQRYVGSENLLIAIATEPEWVKEMYLTVAKLIINMHELMIEKGFEFDGAFLCSDLGYKNGTLFSPKHYEEQLLPADKLVCDYFKDRDIPVILHTDGYVKPLIPYFIKAGFSCLQPLEVKAGMDVRDLKQKYGEKISFMGGIDVRAMADLNPMIIEKEISEKFRIAKAGGGYIYHSDHSVPNNVSFRQYKRVMELVRKYGKY